MNPQGLIFRKLLWIGILPAALAVGILSASAGIQWPIALAAVLVSAAASFGLAYWFSRSLAGRIHRLRDSVQLALQDQVTESSLEPADELGMVARLLDQLSRHYSTVVTHLREESERRQAILSSMVEGVLTVDRELRVTYYNNTFRNLVTMRDAAGFPSPLVEVVRNPEVVEMLKTVIATQQPLSRRLQLTSAETRIFDAHASLMGKSGQTGVVLILHDITDLDRLERVRKDFVANVSHELRTPLTAICGYAETLLDGALEEPENSRRFVEIIDSHAKRLNRIASDLLTLSELESAKPGAVPEPISVCEVLKSAIGTIETEAHQRGIKVFCGDMDDAVVTGFRNHFEQAVLNLVQNAVKFNRPGGEVRVNSRRSNGMICISVADTGVGIPSEDLSRIFERFYRVDKARSREVGGTGLGLSIVKHAIERMNGTVEVTSELGIGSEFRITLPVSNENPRN